MAVQAGLRLYCLRNPEDRFSGVNAHLISLQNCFITGTWNRIQKSKIQHEICLLTILLKPGRVAQSVTCLATDASLTADPGVASLIPVRSHTFVEIDHEIISTVILLPSAE